MQTSKNKGICISRILGRKLSDLINSNNTLKYSRLQILDTPEIGRIRIEVYRGLVTANLK